MQSTLANALNERRSFIQKEKDKYPNYDVLINENKELKQRISDLESIKEKQLREIKILEEELTESVSKFRVLDSKFERERSVNKGKEQKSALEIDKLHLDLIEMRARLEQSRVEYGNLLRKLRSLRKLDHSKNVKFSKVLAFK